MGRFIKRRTRKGGRSKEEEQPEEEDAMEYGPEEHPSIKKLRDYLDGIDFNKMTFGKAHVNIYNKGILNKDIIDTERHPNLVGQAWMLVNEKVKKMQEHYHNGGKRTRRRRKTKRSGGKKRKSRAKRRRTRR